MDKGKLPNYTTWYESPEIFPNFGLTKTFMMGLLQGLRRGMLRAFGSDANYNKWADAFVGMIGGNYSQLDNQQSTYLTEGFQKNSAVFSVIRQRYEKVRSIPYYLKKVDSLESKSKLDVLLKGTNYDFSPAQSRGLC